MALAGTARQVKDEAGRQAAAGGQAGGRDQPRESAATTARAARYRYTPRKEGREYRPTPLISRLPRSLSGAIRPLSSPRLPFRPGPRSTRRAAARAEIEESGILGGKTSSVRTPNRARSRATGTSSPQGWNRIARVVAADRGLDEWESARLMALVNFAMADGFIGGFEAKLYYKYWRPATAIRANGDADWLPDLSGRRPCPTTLDAYGARRRRGHQSGPLLRQRLRVLLDDERGTVRRDYAEILELLGSGARKRRLAHSGRHPLRRRSRRATSRAIASAR